MKQLKLEKSIEAQIAQYDQNMLFRQAEYDANEAEQGGYSNYSYWRSTWSSFTKNKVAIFFLSLLGIVLLFTIIQPLLPNQKNPNEVFWVGTAPDMNHRPDSEFWFGTNSTGQDLWARIWSGTRTSLMIGVIVGLLRAIIGILIGCSLGLCAPCRPTDHGNLQCAAQYSKQYCDDSVYVYTQPRCGNDDFFYVRIGVASNVEVHSKSDRYHT